MTSKYTTKLTKTDSIGIKTDRERAPADRREKQPGTNSDLQRIFRKVPSDSGGNKSFNNVQKIY